MRARLKVVAQYPTSSSNPTLRIAAGATLEFFEFGTTTPISAPLYTTADGSTTYSPEELVTDSRGEFEAYTATGARLTVLATLNGQPVSTTEDTTWDPGDLSGLRFDVKARGGKGDCRKVTDGLMLQGFATLTSATAAFTPSDEGKLVTVRPSESAVTFTDGAGTSGQLTMTSPTANFTAADVGKKIKIQYSGQTVLTTTIAARNSATSITLAAANPATYSGKTFAISRPIIHTTIAAYLNASQVTLQSPAAVAYTNATVDIATDDTAAIQAAIDAAAEAGGGTVAFQGGQGAVYASPGGISMPSGVSYESDGASVRRVGGALVLFLSDGPITEVAFDRMIIDHNHDTFAPMHDLQFAAGSRVIALRDTRFINVGPERVVYFASGATQSDTITIDACTIARDTTEVPRQGVTGEDSEDTQSLSVYDASHVRIERCTFLHCSSVQVRAMTAAACNAATPMVSSVLRDCDFVGVMMTNCFVYAATSGTVMDVVKVEDNRFRDGGKWLEKGAIAVGYSGSGLMTQVSVSGNTVRSMGYLGSSGGYASSNTAPYIIVGSAGGVMAAVRVDHNQCDGSNAAGTASGSLDIGIRIYGPIQGLHVGHNDIRSFGLFGIFIQGFSGAAVRVFHVSHNDVQNCLLKTGTGSVAGGITLSDFVTNGKVTNNICSGNGQGGASHAGIALGDTVFAGGTPETITDVELYFNRCYDTQSPQLQVNGIQVGLPNDTTLGHQPSAIFVRENRVDGNRTAGVYHVSEGSLVHVVDQNYGHNLGTGDVLVTATSPTAPFQLPRSGGLDLPTAGLLVADSVLAAGSHYAAKVYLVVRGPGGQQTLSAITGGEALVSSGVAPTIASTTPSTATFTVTNNDAGSTVTVRWVPLRQGIV